MVRSTLREKDEIQNNTAENAKLQALLGKLNCDVSVECQKARRSLVAMGSAAIPYLVKALASKKRWVRWEAAKALGQIGDSTATEALVIALEDKSFDIRWLAAEGLISIGLPAMMPLLRELTKNADSVWLREGAHHVLHDMNRADLDDILRPVLAALDGPEPVLEVPAAANAALEALQEPRPNP